MAVIGYIRVSSAKQTLEHQHFEIEQFAKKHDLNIDNWVEEKISSRKALKNRKLGELLENLQENDILISCEISRLGRNMLMIMSILNYCVQKGIRIYTIKDNFELSDNINSKIIAFAFALASEIERNLISQRTREALAAKKMAGMKLGRPPGTSVKVSRLLSDLPSVRRRLLEGESLVRIAKAYGIHRNTLSHYLKDSGENIC